MYKKKYRTWISGCATESIPARAWALIDGRMQVVPEDVQAVFPELVEERADGYLGVSYGHMTAVLLQAIKEQQQQIEALRRQVEDLSGSGADLSANR